MIVYATDDNLDLLTESKEWLEIAFPDARVVGSNFHYNQCLYRPIQGGAPLHVIVARQGFRSEGSHVHGLGVCPRAGYPMGVLVDSVFVRNY